MSDFQELTAARVQSLGLVLVAVQTQSLPEERLVESLVAISRQMREDSQARFDQMERQRQALRAEMASTPTAGYSFEVEQNWMATLGAAQRELLDTSLRHLNSLNEAIFPIIDLLDFDQQTALVQAADDVLVEVKRQADAAGAHYDAWSELHQTLHDHLQKQLKNPTRDRRVLTSAN